MSRERTLLERLANPRAEEARSAEANPAALTASVVGHLRQLLNSRQGNAPAQDDYGLPDISEMVHSFPASASGLQRAIKAIIEKYEPRLTGVNVMLVESEDDVLCLRFQITAQIVSPSEKRRRPIYVDTVVESSGRISVSE